MDRAYSPQIGTEALVYSKTLGMARYSSVCWRYYLEKVNSGIGGCRKCNWASCREES